MRSPTNSVDITRSACHVDKYKLQWQEREPDSEYQLHEELFSTLDDAKISATRNLLCDAVHTTFWYIRKHRHGKPVDIGRVQILHEEKVVSFKQSQLVCESELKATREE
eukprot:6839622-Prymnesium_polylepis.2